ncbi:MAG: hypothetical protein EYC62_05730 [Alphaproteobacteria bacterium]|nr:MAG: hypothetical protein EYC62_05730 [Alphaproteobacteria bacterium]
MRTPDFWQACHRKSINSAIGGNVKGFFDLIRSAAQAGASRETLRDIVFAGIDTVQDVLDALYQQPNQASEFQNQLNNQKVNTIIQARKLLELGHRCFGAEFNHEKPRALAFRLADIFANPNLHPRSYDIDGMDHPYFSVGAYGCMFVGIEGYQAKNLESLGVCLIRFGEEGRRKFCDAILPFAKPRTSALIIHDQVAAGGYYSYDQVTRVQFHTAETGLTRRQRFWNWVGARGHALRLGYVGGRGARA